MAKKSKPKTINIMGHKIPVIFYSVDEMPDETEGLFDPTLRQIWLADNETWESTLLHEIIHAIIYFSGHREQIGAIEEGLVLALEHGLSPHVKVIFSRAR